MWKFHEILHEMNPLSTAGLKSLKEAIQFYTVAQNEIAEFLQMSSYKFWKVH